MKKKLNLTLAFLALISAYAFGQDIDQKFDSQKGKELRLDSSIGGDIEIEGWDKNEVWVQITHNDDYEGMFSIKESDGNISISTEGGRSNWGWKSGRIRYDIKVPNQFDVDLRTSGGKIELTGVEGDLEGRTSGGSLRLKELKGDVDFVTSGGSVDLVDVNARGKVTTSGGPIDVSGVKGDFDLITSGGSISLEDSEFDGNVRTSGGSIRSEKIKGKLDMATSGGNIILDDSEISGDVRTSGGNIKVDSAPSGADVATSGGNIKVLSANEFIIAKTSGGNINVDEIDGWVDAATSGGDIEVNMTGDPSQKRRDARLITAGGDVTLYVPDGLEMDIDIEVSFTKRAKKEYKIYSDFDIEQEKTKEWDDSRGGWNDGGKKYIYGKGKIGSGKHKVKIKTVNGNVYLKKA